MHLPFFSGHATVTVAFLQAITCYDGQVIVNAGDCEKQLFHVVRGKVYMLDTADMVVLELGRGDLFGIECLLETGNR